MGISKLAQKFKNLSSEDGNISISFALCFVGLAAAAGGAMDLANVVFTQTKVQGALDASVLAGVSTSTLKEYQIATAEKYYRENAAGFAIEGQQVTFKVVQGKLVGEVNGSVSSSLMRAVGYEKTPLNVTSVGVSGITREPACILAMHPTRKHTLEMKESVSLIAPQCHIYGNSNHFNDVVDPHTPQNFMTGHSVAAVGGGHHYIQNVTPPVEFGHEIIEDPLKISSPSVPTCIGTDVEINGETRVLEPGNYCGGLTVSNGSRVSLVDGGEYVISGGKLEVSDSSINGKNAIVFLQGSTSIELDNSSLVLEAPVSGKYAGLALVGDSVPSSNSFVDSTIDVHGVFYMPSGDLVWTNKGTPAMSAKWSTFVLDGFSWDGSGTINLKFDLAGSEVPFPEALRVIPRPSEPRLIQ
jgi:Flp pilus assembly protein TadG